MKTELVRETFLKAILIANRFIPLRPSIPVLANVLLKSSKGKMDVIATNLESSLRVSIPAKTGSEWEITTPAKILSDFISSAIDEKITLEVDKESLLVESGEFKGTLAGIAASEFPKLPESSAANVNFELKVLQEAINNVAFSASTDEAKPILTGIYINQEQDNTIIVATDGFRLAKKTLSKSYQFEQVVIPAKTFVESLRVAGEMEEETVSLSVAKDQNQVVFTGESFQITSRLLDGTYPQFQQIIPKTFVSEVTVDKAKIMAAIKTMAVFARDLGNVVRMNIKGNKILLTANTAQIGEGSADLEAESTGEELNIAFNSKYLLDSLGAIKANIAELKFSGSLSPAVFSGQKDKDSMYVVMPVKTQN